MKGKKPAGVISTVGAAVPQRADGGRIVEAGGNPAVFEAARKRKLGGRVKNLGGIGGLAAKPRLDRPSPGRKRGGKVGAELGPLSTASKAG